MSPPKNNWLFWIALAVFLIATPIIILSAQGFRWNATGWRIDRIGGVYIAGEPAQALVTVSQAGEPIKSAKVNRLIDGLFPGRYEVVVAANGYATWSRALAIEPSKVARVDHVALLATQPPATLIARLSGLTALNVSSNGELGLAQTTADHFYLLNFSRGDLWRVVVSDTKTARFDSRTVIWTEVSPPTFLALTGTNLSRYTFDETNGQLTAKSLAPQVNAFSTAENKIYALSLKTRTISELATDGTLKPLATLPSLPNGALAPPSGATRLAVLNNETALISVGGELQKIDLKTSQATTLASGVTSFALAPDSSHRLLYASAKTLAILSLTDETPTYPLLKNLVEPIDQLFWADDREHAFIIQNQTLTFLETRTTEPRYQAKLTQTLKPLAFLTKSNQLFAAMLYDDKREGLFRLGL